MKKLKTWLWIGMLIMAVAAIVWMVWPTSKKTSEKPLEKLNAQFLSMDPEWADSVVNAMSLDQKLKALVVHDVSGLDTNTLHNTLEEEYAGVFLSKVDFHLMAYMDSMNLEQDIPLIKGMSFSSILSDIPDSLRTDLLLSSSKDNLEAYTSKYDLIRNYFGINLVSWNYGLEYPVDTTVESQIKSLSYHINRCSNDLLDSDLSDSVLFCLDVRRMPSDTTIVDSVLPILQSKFDRGISALYCQNENEYVQNALTFEGLIIRHHDTSMTGILTHADLYISNDPEAVVSQLKKNLDVGQIKINEIDRSVKRVLMARKWSEKVPSAYHSEKTNDFFNVHADQAQFECVLGSITVVRNQDRVIPVTNLPDRSYLLRVGSKVPSLQNTLSNYTTVISSGISDISESNKVSWTSLPRYNPVIIALNNADLSKDSSFLSQIETLDKQTNVIIINGGNGANLKYLDQFESLVQLQNAVSEEWGYAGQIIMGGLKAEGRLSQYHAENLPAGSGVSTKKTRLGYASPKKMGLSAQVMSGINWIANEGIYNRAYPGCQVLAVKDGNVIYHRSFGHLTYANQTRVTNNHIYDLASVTKVAATTVAAMMLYDQGKYLLQDSLYGYLPDTLRYHIFRGRSTLRHVKWQDLMIHKSGLPPGFPYLKYIEYTDSIYGQFDKFYCDWKDDSCYYVPVAENFYMDRAYQDSIWYKINELILEPSPGYTYSDVNFIMLYKLFKGMFEKDPELVTKPRGISDNDYNAFETFLNEQVYRPLKMKNTTYLPLRYFPLNRIAPTENDRFWRKQLVHGYVHDPSAALLGGISGNAGLFSNAHDVAILFQMLLNKGYYGGKRFINANTVNLFVSRQAGSHRGLGFNKPVGGGMYGIPVEVPIETFGHTGFTGNCVWADPVNDIIFIFLSNRSHPDAHNPKIINLKIWKRIHETIYQSMPKMDWLTPVVSVDSAQVSEETSLGT